MLEEKMWGGKVSVKLALVLPLQLRLPFIWVGLESQGRINSCGRFKFSLHKSNNALQLRHLKRTAKCHQLCFAALILC